MHGLPATAPSLQMRALQWLSQREYSRVELRRRLLRLATRPAAGLSAAASSADPAGDLCEPDPQTLRADRAAAIEVLLDWLAERGYLSDARFAESRVQVRARRLGNLRIVHELRQHGVVLDAEARQQLRDTELARATAVWQRKYGAPAADAAGRVRQMRFLGGRGFSADVVQRVLRAHAPVGADGLTVSGAADDDV